MKKSILLAALLVVPMGIAIAQQDKDRPAPYTMIDSLVRVQKPDWPAVFAIIDSTLGVIDVNEYRTTEGAYYGSGITLLGRAVIGNNFLAVKTLLEKYKANPNVPSAKGATPLWFAMHQNDDAIINLLRKYGAQITK